LSVEELVEQIQHHRKLYWESTPEISDTEFDKLVQNLQAVDPNNPVLDEIGYGTMSGRQKVAHTYPMLSLQKCYNAADLIRWYTGLEGFEVVASPKIDGLAVALRYLDGKFFQAVTRGDGNIGDDVTENMKFVSGFPKVALGGVTDSFEIRGEVFIPKEVFERHFATQYSNPRNLAAGALKREVAKETAWYFLEFRAYDVVNKDFSLEYTKTGWLVEIGCTVVPMVVLNERASIEEYLTTSINAFPYEIDGFVFKAGRIADQKRLGSTRHHPRWSMAYKLQGDSGASKLLSVEWQVGRTGVITPVATIAAVTLSGATINRVSLHNVNIMQKLDPELRLIDAEITVSRRGGVIPNVEEVTKPGLPELVPLMCPVCGGVTFFEEGDQLYAEHDLECPPVLVSTIQHFLKVARIKGMGVTILDALVESKQLKTPSDLFALTSEDLQTVERVGEKTAIKLIARIQDLKQMTLSTFLTSLGIPNLGGHLASTLADNYPTLAALVKADPEELLLLPGVGEVGCQIVTDRLPAKKYLIRDLMKYIEIMEPTIPMRTSGQPLHGQIFLFTGKLDCVSSRARAEEIVESLGGTIASGVTHDLDYLVVGNAQFKAMDEGQMSSLTKLMSAKVKKVYARQAAGGKVRCITEDDFGLLVGKRNLHG